MTDIVTRLQRSRFQDLHYDNGGLEQERKEAAEEILRLRDLVERLKKEVSAHKALGDALLNLEQTRRKGKK